MAVKTGVTDGMRQQASGEAHALYALVDLKGGGELVDLMKVALRTKNYVQLDKRIQQTIPQFLYNSNGKGAMIKIRDIVKKRRTTRETERTKFPQTWLRTILPVSCYRKKTNEVTVVPEHVENIEENHENTQQTKKKITSVSPEINGESNGTTQGIYKHNTVYTYETSV